ncbi:MAG: PIN domain-containing protein [Verrucomicrobia bacterium]|jgi:predicted nucleic acid-binding protein|nr:PIN domain-containing protein [Verrucomicrobiota bacterium]
MQLIDTSAWIDYFKTSGDPDVRIRPASALKANKAALCEMVFLELQGSPNTRQSVAISLLEPVVPVVHIDAVCWSRACQLARLCHQSGHPVPNTDALIYATAERHGCEALHNDKHFDWLDEITGQNITERPLPLGGSA